MCRNMSISKKVEAIVRSATRWKETYNVSTNAFSAYLCEQYEQLLSQLAHEAGETSNTTELAELATYLKKGGGHA